MLSASELWLLRLMADRGLALIDASGLLIIAEQDGELRIAATGGDAPVGVRVLPVAGSALGALYSAGESLSVENPRGRDASWLHELGIDARAVAVAPLAMETGGGGLVVAIQRSRRFNQVDLDALAAFASSVTQRIAAERSVEIERLRHGLRARERERTRWAREIHDETVQGLGALRLMLAGARDLSDVDALRQVVEDVLQGLGAEIEGLRHLITELRPAVLDDLGLAPAIDALLRRAEAIDRLRVTSRIEAPGGRGDRLDEELESTVYRIVQEALTNIGRHAAATEAHVVVEESRGQLIVRVEDNGRGVSAEGDHERAEALGPSGFGLAGMHERAELVSGELSIADRPEGGTVVELRVPLAQRPRAGVAVGAAASSSDGTSPTRRA